MTTMNTDIDVRNSIERAAEAVDPVWPLHSFVTANPLAGFEDRPFHEAVREGERLFSANGYPSAGVFRRAWTNGRIDADVLNAELADHGYEADPEPLLDGMAEREGNEPIGRSTDTTARGTGTTAGRPSATPAGTSWTRSRPTPRPRSASSRAPGWGTESP